MSGVSLPKYLRTVLLAVQYAGQNTTPMLSSETREAAVRAAAAAKKDKADATKKPSETKRKQMVATVLSKTTKIPKSNSSTTSTRASVADDDSSEDDSLEAVRAVQQPRPSKAIANASVEKQNVETRSKNASESKPKAPVRTDATDRRHAQVLEQLTHAGIEEDTGITDTAPPSLPKTNMTKPKQQDEVFGVEPKPECVMPAVSNWEQERPPQLGRGMLPPCNAPASGQPPYNWWPSQPFVSPQPWSPMMMSGPYWNSQPNNPPPFWGMAPPWANCAPPQQCLQWGAAQPPSQMNVNVLPSTPPRVREAAMLAKMKCEVDNLKANLVEAEYKYLHR